MGTRSRELLRSTAGLRSREAQARRDVRSPHARAARANGYEVARPELLALVPRSAARVLDIGCSTGLLGAAIRSRQPAEVVGIEYVEEYCRDARSRLQSVLQGDAQELLASPAIRAELGEFDCIVAGDVLEHLTDPWAALRDAVSMLKPSGAVIVSVPNVRFWQTFWHVGVHGRWPLRDSGLFDRTHLRWFTRRDAEDLLRTSGLDLTHRQGRYKLHYTARKLDRALAPLLKLLPVRDFFAYQYLLVGVRSQTTATTAPAR